MCVVCMTRTHSLCVRVYCVVHMTCMYVMCVMYVVLHTYDGKYERIDQYSDFFHVEQQNRNSSTYTSLQHPTTVLLFHVYHIYTQQLFNFQKIIFFLIPSPSRGLPPVFSSTFDSTSTTLLTWERVV